MVCSVDTRYIVLRRLQRHSGVHLGKAKIDELVCVCVCVCVCVFFFFFFFFSLFFL